MDTQPGAVAGASHGLVEYTHWIYGLHALSVLIGLTAAHTLSMRFVAMRFAFGLPSIIAVIMNYARRSEVRGSWLESHFRWQIRTFWYSWLWIFITSILAVPLLIVVIGFLIAMIGYAVVGLWIIYRVARGWLALREGRPMPLPAL
jgi:uncharacterized membrane protein